MAAGAAAGTADLHHGLCPVSYTHLDVYKRQRHGCGSVLQQVVDVSRVEVAVRLQHQRHDARHARRCGRGAEEIGEAARNAGGDVVDARKRDRTEQQGACERAAIVGEQELGAGARGGEAFARGGIDAEGGRVAGIDGAHRDGARRHGVAVDGAAVGAVDGHRDAVALGDELDQARIRAGEVLDDDLVGRARGEIEQRPRIVRLAGRAVGRARDQLSVLERENFEVRGRRAVGLVPFQDQRHVVARIGADGDGRGDAAVEAQRIRK